MTKCNRPGCGDESNRVLLDEEAGVRLAEALRCRPEGADLTDDAVWADAARRAGVGYPSFAVRCHATTTGY